LAIRVVRKDGGRRLEPDEVSMKIVQRIFNMYIEGNSTLKIAKDLNEENISHIKHAIIKQVTL